ncbi:TY-Chap domain-containing protein [Gordonia sp. DT219]|uniref:TY-Chap domain-containing protein n=1 Tax=Gordonia sp. DT219 TaxID=3416658 RepID=UPI003CFA605B
MDADDMRGDVDFDTAVNEAWAQYRHRLAALLSDLDEGQALVVEQNLDIPEGAHGTLTFTAGSDDRIMCTIVEADLHPHPDWLDENGTALENLGWLRDDGDGSFSAAMPRTRVDELAALATTTLIEIWSAGHPAFLTGTDLVRHEPALDVVALPARHSDLRAMVLEALETMAGPVIVDGDGDIPLPTGEVKSWLRVMPHRATLEFFGTVVENVSDLPAAYEFVATRTMPYTGIKLVVHGTCVVAVLTVEATAFSRHNVAAGIGQWLQFFAEERPEIVDALDAATDPALPEILQTLIELDCDGESLGAEDVAKICGYDHETILDYIRTAEEQHVTWATSADQATVEQNDAEASACRHESDAWAETTRQLRAALRVVALSGQARHRPTAT